MKSSSLRSLFFSGFAILASLCSLTFSQSQTQTRTNEKAAPLVYSVEVELSQIPVRITDKAGKPVAGIREADLELMEDGIPQEIRFLDEIDIEAPRGTRQRTLNIQEKGPAISMFSHNIFIIFDACNSGQMGIEKHKKYIKEFLTNFKVPSTMFCIILIKPTGDYEMIQNFTSNIDALLTATDQIHGAAAGIESKSFMASRLNDSSSLEACAPLSSMSRIECAEQALRDIVYQADSLASEEQLRSSNSVHSLQELFVSAEHVPGQKGVILVSEGMDPAGSFYYNYGANVIQHFIQHFGLPPGMRSVITEIQGDSNRSISKMNEIQALIQSANSSNLPIYWVNPEYGKTVEDISSESSNMASFATKLVNAPDSDLVMRGIANDTGGFPLSSNNMAKFYSELGENIPRYYLIGYKPQRQINDGRVHRIEVRSNNPEYKIAYANSFKDFELKDRIADQLAAAHDFPDLTSAFPIIQEVQYFKNTDGKYHIVIHAAVAYHDLEPQVTGDMVRDDLHLSFIVRNESGKIIFESHPVLQIQLTNDKFTALAKNDTVLDYLQPVSLEPGHYDVSLAVMDAARWETSANSKTINLPGIVDSCLSVSPVMLASHISKSDTFSKVPVSSDTGTILYSDKVLNFSVKRIFPQNGSLNGFYQIYNAKNTSQMLLSVHISFKLFRDKSVFVNETSEREIKSFTDAVQKLISNFFSVPYKNLPPGNYELEIDVRDNNSACTTSSRVSFQIAGENEG